MADASTRREARRRKLLLSSEERLKKIKQLNDELRDSAASEGCDTTDTSAELSGQPHTAASPKQSEDAQEGERTVAALPAEDSQEPNPSPLEAEGGTKADDPPAHSNKEHTGQAPPCKESEDGLTNAGQTHPEELRNTKTASGKYEEAENRNISLSQVPEDCDYAKDDAIPQNMTIPVHLRDSSGLTSTSSAEYKVRSVPAANHTASSFAASSSSQAVEASRPAATGTSVPTVAGPVLTTRELCVAVVAILMRVMLAADWLTGIHRQSIIVPFIALQVVFVCFNSSKQTSDGMMIKVLRFAAMMSNIPQASIKKIQVTLAIVSGCASDLAVYLFAFILTHSVFEIAT